MSLSIEDFGAFHQSVHGYPPFEWQSRLLAKVVNEGRWPRVLDLPTGAGKTTCIEIALFALALDAGFERVSCPRRIAMIVDRRVVVDQVAERGRKLQRTLVAPGATGVVVEVADRLRSLSKGSEEPLGVFVLRGGVPKDDGWARTPDQPLVIASTVDQVGSRLLLQGYGVSRGMRPVHAGLLGNDTLLLLDEVHLSEPFKQTLEQLGRLRDREDRTTKLNSRFQFALLSATPGRTSEERFALTKKEKRKESPLGARLHARKVAKLAETSGRLELEHECVERAAEVLGRHNVVAVVVNRVASAAAIARELGRMLQERADVVLITGRMRPLDRDDVLRNLRGRIETGRERNDDVRKLIVVGTQCIEAGADFDFDALVTESASFDALRQRFGRVDRLGRYAESESCIIHDRNEKDDPIYGTAIVETIAWLKENLDKKTKAVDFGVLALPVPDAQRLEELCAPKERAPVLFPSYLDLWMQTSPVPQSVPDVSLWLHGPRDTPAEVQVVWRADLTQQHLDQAFGGDSERERGLAVRVVASIRPSSLEAMPLPFGVARKWLSGEAQALELASDVEGQRRENERNREGVAPGRLVLRWDGNDSEVVDARQLRPGDTVVVPAARGGIDASAKCFDPAAGGSVPDLAERAAFFSRGLPMLRIHPEVVAGVGLAGIPVEELPELRQALADRATEASGWRGAWLGALSRARGVLLVDSDEPWMVLRGRKLSAAEIRAATTANDSAEDGVDLTTDADDSFHAGRAVALDVHSGDVERFAREYAARVGFDTELVNDLALAGWLHDIGKADSRFQVMLRGGSEIELLKDPTPWAKSKMAPEAKAEHRRARERSGYPRGARHEVQSLAMLEHHVALVRERAIDLDLVLHLVASHHGYCRPFAPAVIDETPVEVRLDAHASTVFGTWKFEPVTSKHELHRLDSPLADRFWRLVKKYGWLELCWLEAILRLADHRASEVEAAGRSGGEGEQWRA